MAFYRRLGELLLAAGTITPEELELVVLDSEEVQLQEEEKSLVLKEDEMHLK